MTRTWLRRLAGALLLTAALYVFFVLIDLAPRPLPLTIVVLAGAALAGLMSDAMGATPVGWAVPRRSYAPAPGHDGRTASYLRLIEDNLTAREPRPLLRDRLRVLADVRLRQRHDLELADPRAEPLLGPEAYALLTGPPRRISPQEIDRTLTRIEEL